MIRSTVGASSISRVASSRSSTLSSWRATRASISVCGTSISDTKRARDRISCASSLRVACASSPAPYVFESHDRAEEKHAAVAAASVIAKVLRDERFAQIRQRYEGELGPIRGGGYANAETRRWLRAYAERYGRLPDETRLSWPHPYVEDLLGDVRPAGPQAELFS